MQRTNPYLLCFKNGVLDIKEKKFRPILEDDYLEKCTNIDYIPIDHQKHKKTIDEINDFMTILFPSPQKREYMWEHLASILIGVNLEQKMHFYNGSGPNGKSIIIHLLSLCLGDYYTVVPYSLIYSSIYSRFINKPSKKNPLNNIMLKLKESRLAVITDDCEGETLNDCVLKMITGGTDGLVAIGLNDEPISFIPQFKIVVCSNNLNSMNVDDQSEGVWRRIAVVNFDNKIDYRLVLNYDIEEKIPIWREVFMSMLVDIVLKTQGVVKRCEIIDHDKLIYRNQQDVVSDFITNRIVEQEGSRIKKRELAEEFKYYIKNVHGRKPPKAARLYEVMNNKFGEYNHGGQYNNGWKNVTLIYEDSEDDE